MSHINYMCTCMMSRTFSPRVHVHVIANTVEPVDTM